MTSSFSLSVTVSLKPFLTQTFTHSHLISHFRMDQSYSKCYLLHRPVVSSKKFLFLLSVANFFPQNKQKHKNVHEEGNHFLIYEIILNKSWSIVSSNDKRKRKNDKTLSRVSSSTWVQEDISKLKTKSFNAFYEKTFEAFSTKAMFECYVTLNGSKRLVTTKTKRNWTWYKKCGWGLKNAKGRNLKIPKKERDVIFKWCPKEVLNHSGF